MDARVKADAEEELKTGRKSEALSKFWLILRASVQLLRFPLPSTNIRFSAAPHPISVSGVAS